MKKEIKKVLLIGSGPIIIGQAAEFDYSGSQAVVALKKMGLEVVLINSNPATIMTDESLGAKIYMEPLELDYIQKIIYKERPDGILATFGGQTALNLALKLHESGLLKKLNIPLLGTDIESIKLAEDRSLFRDLLRELDLPYIESMIVGHENEIEQVAASMGFPLVLRPAFTLGGSGGGIAKNMDQFQEMMKNALKLSPVSQCLVEKSIYGYLEFEYEVIRDTKNQAIIICNMENIDPVGVHTGDSMVVAPAQTLRDSEHQRLREVALSLVKNLNIVGACNVQFAMNPTTRELFLIEVNPRVSRSSALASKATGYPIAAISAQLCLGLTLDEINLPINGATKAFFEPSLDYVVTKIPRWPFDKFQNSNRKLTTQMKSTGEIMSLGRTFEESFLKGLRSLELDIDHLSQFDHEALHLDELMSRLADPDDERIFLLNEAFNRGLNLDEIYHLTKIDRFFLARFKAICEFEQSCKKVLTKENYFKAKKWGYTDSTLSSFSNTQISTMDSWKKELGLHLTYKMVDSCAAEFEATTPYYYSTWEWEDEIIETDRKKVIVIGSGPIRIGQGIEFDYATVRCIQALKAQGIEAVIINNNPETVSTDFSLSDRLYFEPLFAEDVLNVIKREKTFGDLLGVIIQLGGQTALNLTDQISEIAPILGTTPEDIESAENREIFEDLLQKLELQRPKGFTVSTIDQGVTAATKLKYPLMVRPSYVLGGRAMQIVHDEASLHKYLSNAFAAHSSNKVLIDQYLLGKEVELDALCDGENIFIPGIMEHIEKAGVHSGDSIAVYPTLSLSSENIRNIIAMTKKLALALNIKGLINIQFVIFEGEIYILEANPRSSRTLPFISKVTGYPMADLATFVMLGQKINHLNLPDTMAPISSHFSVKVPVFSFPKMRNLEVGLGPEMKSTGEVIGCDHYFAKALLKGLQAANHHIPSVGKILITVADKHKPEILTIARSLTNCGYMLVATAGTYQFLKDHHIEVEYVKKIGEGHPNLIDLITNQDVHMVINTMNRGESVASDGYLIRRCAVERGLVCLTSLDTALAISKAIEETHFGIFVNDKKHTWLPKDQFHENTL